MTSEQRCQLKHMSLLIALQTPGELLDNAKQIYKWLLKDEEGEAEEAAKKEKVSAQVFQGVSKDLNA